MELHDEIVIPYLDNVNVLDKPSKSMYSTYMSASRLREHGIKLKKWKLFKHEVTYLGTEASRKGYRIDIKTQRLSQVQEITVRGQYQYLGISWNEELLSPICFEFVYEAKPLHDLITRTTIMNECHDRWKISKNTNKNGQLHPLPKLSRQIIIVLFSRTSITTLLPLRKWLTLTI